MQSMGKNLQAMLFLMFVGGLLTVLLQRECSRATSDTMHGGLPPGERPEGTRVHAPTPPRPPARNAGPVPPRLNDDGTDINNPQPAPDDDGFVDTRGGWGWGDRCWIHIKSGKWGWAKWECDRAMAVNPASPQPRASLLYNEGLLSKRAGKLSEARQQFLESLSLREHPEVRAALNSLPPE